MQNINKNNMQKNQQKKSIKSPPTAAGLLGWTPKTLYPT